MRRNLALEATLEEPSVKFLSAVGAFGKGCHAAITLEVDGEVRMMQAIGNGPINAAVNCIRLLVPHGAKMTLDKIEAGDGEDSHAPGRVSLTLTAPNGESFKGDAEDCDTIIAAIYAYLDALNKLRRVRH